MSALSLIFCAVLAAVSPEKPKAEVSRASFVLPHIDLVRKPSTAPTAMIKGIVRVKMGAFVRDCVKCPILRMCCLLELNGQLVCREAFFKSPNGSERLTKSEITAAIKASCSFSAAYAAMSSEERKEAIADPSCFTPLLPEVTSRIYSPGCSYGDPRNERDCFFRLSRLKGDARIMLTHLEMWQNGVCIGSYDSSRTGLGKYEIPKDWYVPKKYPQRFKYEDAR